MFEKWVMLPVRHSKSGKKTYGKDRFWSGKDRKAKAGLEIGCLAVVDVADATAYSVEAVQTPANMKDKLVAHYVGILNVTKTIVGQKFTIIRRKREWHLIVV